MSKIKRKYLNFDLYTQSEADALHTTLSGNLQTNIDGKSDLGHLHDDRYYTETEVDTISGSLRTDIDINSDDIYANAYIPKDLLIYYGWPSVLNGHGNNEDVAHDMARYNLIVLADVVTQTGHGDYANTAAIVARVKQLKPQLLLFCYVNSTISLAAFKAKVDFVSAASNYDGIFIDNGGYDFGQTRTQMSDKIDYVHASNCNIVFMNAWNINHIIGVDNDPSYPNSTYNSTLEPSHLTEDDWYLMESYPVNTTTSGNICSKADWLSRGNTANNKREEFGLKLCSVSVIESTLTDTSELFKFHQFTALMFSLDGHGTSDTSYASITSKIPMYERNKWKDMGLMYEKDPSITVSTSDADVYYRYTADGKVICDHSVTIPEITYTNTITEGEYIRAEPAVDHSANGPKCDTISAGEDITVMYSVYLHSDGKWHITNASSTATSDGMLAIALETKNTNDKLNVAMPGSFIRDDSWSWTVGGKIYLKDSIAPVWSVGGALGAARDAVGGFGVQNAALCFGGAWTFQTSEEYNGVSWASGGSTSAYRRETAGCGTQNTGLAFGGNHASANNTSEEYNGTSWSSGGNLNTGRNWLAGAGTQTAGLSIGGNDTGGWSVVTEEYNGTSWAAGGNLGTARYSPSSAGTQTAGLAVGGAGPLNTSEEYNGSAWSAGGNIATSRYSNGGAGTQTEALTFGGWNGTTTYSSTERYNGTSWSAGNSLNTGRYTLGGCGTQTLGLSFGGYTGGYSAVTELYALQTITQTAPTTSGNVIRIIGHATHADRLFFNPEQTIVVHN